LKIPAGDAVLESAWLSGLLGESSSWPHGWVRVMSAERIGTDYGLSGHVHRVVAEAEHGGSLTFVVKRESAEAVERALLFQRQNGEILRGAIPECFAGASDRETGRGVLVFDDVAPAEQGDVLAGCTDEQAEALVRVLARVHGASWRSSDDSFPARLPRWDARPLGSEQWSDRLTRAGERFPGILTPTLSERLHDVPVRVARAVERLRAGPASWIHVDAHLDNVLWRRDGTAVLLDWSGAAIGPPAVDLARCLTEGVDAGSQPERAAALLSTYVLELRTRGVDASIVGLRRMLADGLVLLLQSAVGWAGKQEDREPPSRLAALRENLLRSVCAWRYSD
jgi:aminoglycoside phosphotransferase (APT) family kinase protein